MLGVDFVARTPDIRMKLVFEEEKRPRLLDITTLLYDFELTHDFSLLLTAEEYSNYRFSGYFWRRNGRKLKSSHVLRAIRIEKRSPLTVEILIASIVVTSGSIWTLVQIIEKVANWKFNRQKLRLEIQKLEREKRRYQEHRDDLGEKAEERGAAWVLGSLIGQLEKNPLKLVDIEITPEEKMEKED